MRTLLARAMFVAAMGLLPVALYAQPPGCGDCYQYHDPELGWWYHCFLGGEEMSLEDCTGGGEETEYEYVGIFDCDEGDLGPTWCHTGAQDYQCSQHHRDCPYEADLLLAETYDLLEDADGEGVRALVAREERVTLENGVIRISGCHGGLIARIDAFAYEPAAP